jgi:hypothetical protein
MMYARYFNDPNVLNISAFINACQKGGNVGESREVGERKDVLGGWGVNEADVGFALHTREEKAKGAPQERPSFVVFRVEADGACERKDRFQPFPPIKELCLCEPLGGSNAFMGAFGQAIPNLPAGVGLDGLHLFFEAGVKKDAQQQKRDYRGQQECHQQPRPNTSKEGIGHSF